MWAAAKFRATGSPAPPIIEYINANYSRSKIFSFYFSKIFLLLFLLCYLYLVFLCVFSYVFVLWIFVSVYFDEVFTTICVPYSLLFSSFFGVFLVKKVYFFDLKMLVI